MVKRASPASPAAQPALEKGPYSPFPGMTPLVAEGLLQLLWKLNYWQIQQKDPEEVSEGGWAPESLPEVLLKQPTELQQEKDAGQFFLRLA